MIKEHCFLQKNSDGDGNSKKSLDRWRLEECAGKSCVQRVIDGWEKKQLQATWSVNLAVKTQDPKGWRKKVPVLSLLRKF